MKGLTQTTIIIGIILIIAVGGFISAQQMGLLKAYGLTQYTSGGIYVKSVSPINIVQNGQVSGTYLIDTLVSGGSNEIVGKVSTTDVNSLTSQKVTSEKDLNIKITTRDETLYYDPINLQEQIFKYTIVSKKGCSITCQLVSFFVDPSVNDPAKKNEAKEKLCGRTDIDYVIQTSQIGFTQTYCIRKDTIARAGYITNPTIVNKANITLTVGSDTITREIASSGSSSSVDFILPSGQNVANAKILSNLVTGNPLPPVYLYFAYFDKFGVEWKINDKSALENYNTKKALADQQLGLTWGFTNIAGELGSVDRNNNLIETYINDFNTIAERLITTNKQIDPYARFTNVNSEANGRFVVQLDRQITSPEIIFEVQASWIGVKKNVGKPVINGLSSNKVNLGSESVTITANVKNDANSPAVFIPTVSGCEPFVQKYQNDQIQFSSYETKSVILDLSTGSTAQALAKTCTVCFYDSQSPSAKDCKTVLVETLASRQCTPNTQRYDTGSNCIFTCDPTGMTEVRTECCQYGQTYDQNTGKYTCKTAPKQGCQSDAECNDGNALTRDTCVKELLGNHCENIGIKPTCSEAGMSIIDSETGRCCSGLTEDTGKICRGEKGFVIDPETAILYIAIAGLVIGIGYIIIKKPSKKKR